MPRVDYIDRRTGSGMFEYEDASGASLPHVVLITIDMAPQDFFREGEANWGLARTPSIDAIRAQGVEFTNAFSNSPLCGPSRASYLTGRYPYLTVNDERAHDGWAVELRADDIIFPEYLKARGYVTKHAGKCHVGAGKFRDAFGEADAAWDRWAQPMTDDDGYAAHLARLGVTPPVYRDPVRGRRAHGPAGNNYGGFVTQRDGRAFPEEATYAHYLAALVAERLDAAREQGVAQGAPLYLQVDFFEPHQPFMIPGGKSCEDRAEELRRRVKMPASFARAAHSGGRALSGEPRIYSLYRREAGLGEEDAMREYIAMNALGMEVLDRAVGKVKAALQERGLWDDALVIFAADHGEMCGELALVDKGAYAHPKVARVPLFVKPPRGGARAGVRIDEPVCLLDLAPTVLEAAGVRPFARLDGESLLSRATGAPASGDGRMFIFEACWHVAPNPAVACQWRRGPDEHYWYAYNLTSEFDELYDLADRSYSNLAGEAEFAGIKAEMVRRLGEFLKADPRWRCYWHTMRVDKQEELPAEEGDHQMFRPE